MVAIAGQRFMLKAPEWFPALTATVLILLLFSTSEAYDRPPIQGAPRVLHFTRDDFKTDPQIWTMCQDKQGILYFGSNSGTLVYDGETWQTVKLPNNSSVRSLGVSSDGKVYAGGFNEFGIIQRDGLGRYYYQSMMSLLRVEDRNIENIWSIHEVQGSMVFRSYRMLIAVSNNKATAIPSSSVFDYATVLGDKLFVLDGTDLKQIDVQSLEVSRLAGREQFSNETLLALLPGFEKHALIAITKQGSLFTIDVERKNTSFLQRLIPERSSNRITSAIKTSAGHYYFGTLTSKVIALNSLGQPDVAKEVFSDLQDNTVLNLFESKEGNIWALLNNGIDCIVLTSPVTQLFDKASVLDAMVTQKKIYLATNQGVYVANKKNEGERYSKNDFEFVSGLEGQSWSLQEFENEVLASHDEGVVVLHDKEFKIIPGAKGVWKTIAIRERPGFYLACAYDGIFLMQFQPATGFKILHKLEGFNESSRDILEAEEDGVYWVCHGYKGVFRIKIDNEYKRVVGLDHFKDQNGLPSPFNINVVKWKNQIVFTTNSGIYTYNAKVNRFEPHAFLTGMFGKDKNVRKLLDAGDKTWFVHDDEAGYFNTNDKNPVLVKGLFLQLKNTFNPSMECIVPISDQNVLMGTREGLFAFDLHYNRESQHAQTLITAVQYSEGETEVAASLATDKKFVQHLPYSASSIRFNFAVPCFVDKTDVQYSYKVEGINASWLPWQDNPIAEFSLLTAGRYVFHVRARNLIGEMASEDVYAFELLPIWYRTKLAYAFYVLASIACLFLIVRLIQKRIHTVRRKTIEEEQEKRRLLELEVQRFRLEREKEEIIKDKAQLEEDVIFKSKELANYTMLLVKKRELLSEMAENLKGIKDSLKNDQARQVVRDLQRKINMNLMNEEHLQIFEANFERVHSEFFAQLKNNFRDLSAKELQLCAFVKMNLTNKEIASILNLSVRGVETARYRLRKRLGIGHDVDMGDFLEKLYASSEVSSE